MSSLSNVTSIRGLFFRPELRHTWVMPFAVDSSGGGGLGSPSEIRLYDWAPSPFCMKVRAVLEHKGLPYERVPALKRVREIRRRGGIGKVPALELGGELHIDSTDIVHALERRFPEPAVLPADRRERGLCHALEEYADEALYFFGLYYHWHDPPGRRAVQKYFARTLLGRVLFRPFLGLVERQLRGHGTSRKSAAHVRGDLERNLDAIEAMLADREYLLGAGPYLCDFAIGGQLLYLTLAPTTKQVLDGRPGCRALLSRLHHVHL